MLIAQWGLREIAVGVRKPLPLAHALPLALLLNHLGRFSYSPRQVLRQVLPGAYLRSAPPPFFFFFFLLVNCILHPRFPLNEIKKYLKCVCGGLEGWGGGGFGGVILYGCFGDWANVCMAVSGRKFQ